MDLKMTEEQIVQSLWKDAHYAVNSLSLNLIYKTLGKIEMAVDIGAVRYEAVDNIHRYLVKDTLNNPKIMHKLER